MTPLISARRLAALALALIAQSSMTPAVAQTAQTAQPAKAAQPAKKAPLRKGVPPPTTPAQRAALQAADEQQLAAAELVHYGKYVCDEKIEIFVEKDPRSAGYVDVRHKKDVWVMKPVASATGAVRLEDIDQNVLLVQIPYKSMLLNVKSGQRIVDSCQHDNQIATEKADKAAAAK
jgi:hypothetical protein